MLGQYFGYLKVKIRQNVRFTVKKVNFFVKTLVLKVNNFEIKFKFGQNFRFGVKKSTFFVKNVVFEGRNVDIEHKHCEISTVIELSSINCDVK